MKVLPLSEMIIYLRKEYYHNCMNGQSDPRIQGLHLVAKIYGISYQELANSIYKS